MVDWQCCVSFCTLGFNFSLVLGSVLLASYLTVCQSFDQSFLGLYCMLDIFIHVLQIFHCIVFYVLFLYLYQQFLEGWSNSYSCTVLNSVGMECWWGEKGLERMFGVVFMDKEVSHIFLLNPLKLLLSFVFVVLRFWLNGLVSRKVFPEFCRIWNLRTDVYSGHITQVPSLYIFLYQT